MCTLQGAARAVQHGTRSVNSGQADFVSFAALTLHGAWGTSVVKLTSHAVNQESQALATHLGSAAAVSRAPPVRDCHVTHSMLTWCHVSQSTQKPMPVSTPELWLSD